MKSAEQENCFFVLVGEPEDNGLEAEGNFIVTIQLKTVMESAEIATV